jgi:hypothetical protein
MQRVDGEEAPVGKDRIAGFRGDPGAGVPGKGIEEGIA